MYIGMTRRNRRSRSRRVLSRQNIRDRDLGDARYTPRHANGQIYIIHSPCVTPEWSACYRWKTPCHCSVGGVSGIGVGVVTATPWASACPPAVEMFASGRRVEQLGNILRAGEGELNLRADEDRINRRPVIGLTATVLAPNPAWENFRESDSTIYDCLFRHSYPPNVPTILLRHRACRAHACGSSGQVA